MCNPALYYNNVFVIKKVNQMHIKSYLHNTKVGNEKVAYICTWKTELNLHITTRRNLYIVLMWHMERDIGACNENRKNLTQGSGKNPHHVKKRRKSDKKNYTLQIERSLHIANERNLRSQNKK